MNLMNLIQILEFNSIQLIVNYIEINFFIIENIIQGLPKVWKL